jgi:hypothetical protein
MNREPVCELDPEVCILFHNHHTSSRAVLPDRHREISFHFCLSFLPPYGQCASSQTTPCLFLTLRNVIPPARVESADPTE